MIVTRSDAVRIINHYQPGHAPDSFRFSASSTKVFAPTVAMIAQGVPCIVARKLAPGKGSAVRLGQMHLDCTIDWEVEFELPPK